MQGNQTEPDYPRLAAGCGKVTNRICSPFRPVRQFDLNFPLTSCGADTGPHPGQLQQLQQMSGGLAVGATTLSEETKKREFKRHALARGKVLPRPELLRDRRTSPQSERVQLQR